MNHVYAISPAFTGSRLLKDPVSGLIYSNQMSGFTLAKKLKFLEVAKQVFPDLTAACELVGITKTAYKCHYMADPVFAAQIDAIEETVTDKIEAAMAKYALQQGNFMDRIAWLRAHRGVKYNEKKIIQIQPLSSAKIEEKKVALEGAIDAELVVDAPTAPAQIAESVDH